MADRVNPYPLFIDRKLICPECGGELMERVRELPVEHPCPNCGWTPNPRVEQMTIMFPISVLDLEDLSRALDDPKFGYEGYQPLKDAVAEGLNLFDYYDEPSPYLKEGDE